jgi:cysteine desulfurase
MELAHERHAVRDRIYLDANATTPPRREVVEAMAEAALGGWGNPSAAYAEGAFAKKRMDWARGTFAQLMGGVDPETIHFTSSGTESNNVAIRSVFIKAVDAAPRRNVVVTSAVEHPSVKRTAASIRGGEHVMVRVDDRGFVDESHYAEVLKRYGDRVCLISVMTAQNEVGSLQPIPRLVAAARRMCPRAVFHTDATQAFGKFYVDPRSLGDVDLLTASAHKFHGPRGVGILYAKKGLIDPSCTPMTGGGQEGGCRSGTENVAAIVGAAVALELALASQNRSAQTKANRDEMARILVAAMPGSLINGDLSRGLYNTLSISLPGGVHAHALAELLDKEYSISLGSGSACSKGKPSEALMAMFAGKMGEKAAFDRIHSTLRISLTHDLSRDDCTRAAASIVEAWRRFVR